MIRALLSVLGPEHRAELRRSLGLDVAAAVLQGVAFALLVPVLGTLLGPDPAATWPWIGALVVVATGYGLLTMRAVAAGYEAGGVLLRRLHHRLGDHVAVLPLGWFGAARVGELGTLATQGVMAVANAPANLLRPLISALVTPATVLVLMAVFDWRLALAALCTLPVAALAYRFSGALVARSERATAATAAEASTRVVEYARTQPVLRAAGATGRGARLLDEALVAHRDATRRLTVTAVPGLVLFAITVQLAFTAVLLVGVFLAVAGSVAAPQLVALLVLAVRFVEPLLAAAELGGALRAAGNALDRVRTVLDTPVLPEPDASTRRVPDADPDVEFDHVDFSYGGEPVLHDVSFRLPARGVTAVVGPSGAGKTTLTRLIARFFDVDAGAVRVGGVDVRDVATSDLMASVSPVFQDVYLFDTTIAENIRLARPDAGDAAVADAARLARVDEIVERLPDGWDTRVGEGGTALSGGERQRVSIARAILKDAPIVLLDEATAALDPENEAALRDAVTALARDRTVLVIAHRAATVAAADQVLMVEAGRITATGTHAALMAERGRYAAFWSARDRAGGWRLTTTGSPT